MFLCSHFSYFVSHNTRAKLRVSWHYFQYSRIFVHPQAVRKRAALRNDVELMVLTFVCKNTETARGYKCVCEPSHTCRDLVLKG